MPEPYKRSEKVIDRKIHRYWSLIIDENEQIRPDRVIRSAEQAEVIKTLLERNS